MLTVISHLVNHASRTEGPSLCSAMSFIREWGTWKWAGLAAVILEPWFP
jgi:hypothetical protein